MLLWESEALQVDKALSGNGIHVQAGCAKWHWHQVGCSPVLMPVNISCGDSVSSSLVAGRREDIHYLHTEPLWDFPRGNPNRVDGFPEVQSAAAWPLCSLTCCNANAPLGVPESQDEGSPLGFERNPSEGLIFFRSRAVLSSLLQATRSPAFSSCYLSLPDREEGVLGQHCCQALGRYSQDWRKPGLARAPQLASELQKKGKNRCPVERLWIKDALKRPYFNCISWVTLD